MSLRYDFSDPYLKERVAQLPERMLAWAYEVLMDQAHLIADLAKVYAPVDTGSLRDSIRVERGGEGLHWRRVSVRAGGYVTNPKTSRLVDYAVVVEERQPYLGPAVDEVRPTIAAMIKARVVSKAE